MKRVAQRAPQFPKELIGPPIPQEGATLWRAFVEIPRAPAMSGVGPLMPSEMIAWSALTGVKLRAWHVSTLRSMDNAFQRGFASPSPEPPKRW